jgi:hypothetical protein
MGWLDRLLGRREEPAASRPAASWSAGSTGQTPASSDEQALQRYRYMIQTAPPETIEQAHEEAFAKLTPQQRAQALRELAAVTPAGERAAVGDRDDPKTLARLATRAEMRQPGTMERTFGRGGMGGMGMGGMMAGTIFSSLVAGFVGSMIANQFFDSIGGFDSIGDADVGAGGVGESVASQQPMETMGDDFGGGDFGGDF